MCPMNDVAAPGPAQARRRSRTPSADVERELAEAAEAVLVRDGPAGLTVRAVAAEAGVALASVYNRFGGKDGLVEILLIAGFDRLRAAMESAAEPDLLARLLSCGHSYRDFALANPAFYAIMFEDRPHGQLSPLVHEHAEAAFGALVRTVELAAASGAIRAPEAAEVAQQLWSAVHGAIALELRDIVLTPDPAATFDGLLATLVRGLAPGAD